VNPTTERSTAVEHVKKTLDLILEQAQDLQRQLIEKQRMANELCRILQTPSVFQNIEASSSSFIVRPDEYYGKPIADVIRSILEKRKSANLGAATVAEIHDAMLAGGYEFQTENPAYARRGLYSVLAANEEFHRLPNGRYGLKQWYPTARAAGEQNGGKQKLGGKRAKPKRKSKSALGVDELHPEESRAKTRLEEVRELLRTNGPMHRKEIREKSGLPEGTVAFLLNKKNFKHDSDGRWTLKDEDLVLKK
jgi:hypothetical protein